MGATGTYALPFQDDNDPPDGPALGEDLAEAVEDELIRIDAAAAALDGRVDVLEAWDLIVARSSDSSAKTNNTLADDTQLVTPSLPANSLWIVQGWLWYSCASATPDIKMRFSGPASATGAWSLWGGASSITSGTNNAVDQGVQASMFSSDHVRGTINGTLSLLANGYLSISGTAGVVKLQWAQNTTDANGVTLKLGSSLRFRRVS